MNKNKNKGLKYAQSEIINSKSELNRLDSTEDRVIELEDESLEYIYTDVKIWEKRSWTSVGSKN